MSETNTLKFGNVTLHKHGSVTELVELMLQASSSVCQEVATVQVLQTTCPNNSARAQFVAKELVNLKL